MRMNSKKKIGMIIFNYPLGPSLSLINTAISLAQEGYEVHIFIDRLSFDASKINFADRNIIIHIIKNVGHDKYRSGTWNKRVFVFHNRKFEKVTIGNVYWFIYLRLIKSRIMPLMHLLYNKDSYRSYSFSRKLRHYTKHFFKDLFEFYRKILNCIDSEYTCIIGVEPEGLIAAFLMNKKIPIIYFNLELLLEKECKSSEKKNLKSLERDCNKKSFLTIIQDERRAKYLIDDNNIPKEKIVHVPVSALGDIYQDKSDYLHRILNISRDKKIVLYIANIVPWSMSLEIAESAQKWNDNIVLVLHTWRTNLSNDQYVNQIRSLTKNKKVYLSLNPVEWESLPGLVSSADIGLIFYQNQGKNFYETGSSSNKLAQYLQVGLPVITIDFPSFRAVFEKYKCGKCAKNPEEIEKLANEIFLDYAAYRNNSFKCYQEKYEFSKYFGFVIDKIKNIEYNRHNRKSQ